MCIVDSTVHRIAVGFFILIRSVWCAF
jgi:hypothetical protein